MLDPRRLLLDLRERPGDVAMRDSEIADIGKVESFDLGPGCRMVPIDQHAARLADCRWPEARPGPVGGAEIKRNSGDADRRVCARILDAEKRRPGRKSRDGGHSPYLGRSCAGERALRRKTFLKMFSRK